MNRKLAATALLVGATVLVAGCSDEPTVSLANAGKAGAAGAGEPVPGRWYTAERIERGGEAYAQYCASCHGRNAQGAFAWRRRGADGKLPPPPLDGTAHAWHHPSAALVRQIEFGTPGGQDSMPGFGEHLDDGQVADVIAWLQDHWSDDIYDAWLERERQSRR